MANCIRGGVRYKRHRYKVGVNGVVSCEACQKPRPMRKAAK